jgi:hypothetical protein
MPPVLRRSAADAETEQPRGGTAVARTQAEDQLLDPLGGDVLQDPLIPGGDPANDPSFGAGPGAGALERGQPLGAEAPPGPAREEEEHAEEDRPTRANAAARSCRANGQGPAAPNGGPPSGGGPPAEERGAGERAAETEPAELDASPTITVVGEREIPDGTTQPEEVEQNEEPEQDVAIKEGEGEAEEEEAPAIEEEPEEEEAVAAIEEAAGEPVEPQAPAEVDVSPAPSVGRTSARSALGVRGTLQNPNGDPFLHELFGTYSGRTPTEHAAANEVALTELSTHVDRCKTEIAQRTQQLGQRLDAEIAARVQSLTTAHAAAAQGLRGGLANARGQVESAASSALAQIDSGVTTALSAISSSEASRLSELSTGFEAQSQSLEQTASQTVTSFSAAFDGKVTEIRDLGDTKAGLAIATGDRMAADYRSRGGDGIDGKRNEARAKAATLVAEEYASALRKNAGELADEVAKGSGNIPSIVSEMVDPVTAQLQDQMAQAVAGVGQMAAQARAQVETSGGAARAGVEQGRAAALEQLSAQERSGLIELDQTATTMKANIRAAGEALKSQFKSVESELATRYHDAMTSISEVMTSGELANADEAQVALETQRDDFGAQRDAQLGELDQAMSAGLAELDVEVANAAATLGRVAAEASRQGAEAAAGLAAGLTDTAAQLEAGVAEVSSANDSALGQLVKDSVDTATKAVENTGKRLREQQEKVTTELTTVREQASGRLDEELAKEAGDIQREAEKAASQVQPLWRKALAVVAAVVVSVVVFVAVSAFCVATLGTGAVVAAIIAGALSGGAAVFASDCVMGQLSSPMEYVSAIIIGAVTCGLGAKLGIGQMSRLGQFGAGSGLSFVTSTLDQIFDIALMNESWNWKEWATLGAIGVLTAGVFAKFNPPSFGEGVRGALFRSTEKTTWNNFQGRFSSIFKGTTPTERSIVYQTISEKIDDDLDTLVQESLKLLEELRRGKSIDDDKD